MHAQVFFCEIEAEKWKHKVFFAGILSKMLTSFTFAACQYIKLKPLTDKTCCKLLSEWAVFLFSPATLN